jgi:hypothetical protein
MAIDDISTIAIGEALAVAIIGGIQASILEDIIKLRQLTEFRESDCGLAYRSTANWCWWWRCSAV